MRQFLSGRLIAVGLVVTAIVIVVGAAQARTSTSTGTVVQLKKTALGMIVVNAKGHTLYLFEKDKHGVSMCNSACAKFWPPLTSKSTPRAGKGVKQSLLKLAAAKHGVRQVLYAGHPLYTYVGDTRAGQTTGEGLNIFGAEWYAVGANAKKVEGGGGGYPSQSGGGYGSGSGGGW